MVKMNDCVREGALVKVSTARPISNSTVEGAALRLWLVRNVEELSEKLGKETLNQLPVDLLTDALTDT